MVRVSKPGALLVAIGLSLGCQKPPEHKWSTLTELKNELHGQQAHRYAARNFERFSHDYESLRLRYRRAAVQSPLFRDGGELAQDLTRQLAAGRAILTETLQAKETLRQEQAGDLETISRILDSLFPTLHPDLRSQLTSVQIQLAQAQELWEKGEFWRVAPLIDQARASAASVAQNFEELVARLGDPRWIEQWQSWSQETIRWSRINRQPALIIDKFHRRALVYEDGYLSRELAVELGWNGLADKVRAGDGTTPEGRYRVLKKKGADETRFFRALLLNYPNRVDREEFRQARLAGELGESDEVGGLIEIHGEGGRGADWTQGCVALDNASMVRLFDMAYVGMPVTIVGRFEP